MVDTVFSLKPAVLGILPQHRGSHDSSFAGGGRPWWEGRHGSSWLFSWQYLFIHDSEMRTCPYHYLRTFTKSI